MRRALVGLVLTLAFAAPASAHPSYRWCGQHGCTRAHRAYRVRCGGWDWLSPRPVRVPAEWRNAPRMRWWCEANVPSFPSNRAVL